MQTSPHITFGLSWRFTDARYNRLPQHDLDQIEPFDRETSDRLWRSYVSDQHRHISQFTKEDIGEFVSLEVDWDEKDASRGIIESRIPIDIDERVIFFWSPVCSVETKWKIVLQYWDDFFYPDDSNTVVLVPSRNMKIYYCEECFLFQGVA